MNYEKEKSSLGEKEKNPVLMDGGYLNEFESRHLTKVLVMEKKWIYGAQVLFYMFYFQGQCLSVRMKLVNLSIFFLLILILKPHFNFFAHLLKKQFTAYMSVFEMVCMTFQKKMAGTMSRLKPKT